MIVMYRNFEEYRHACFEPYMDWDDFVASWEEKKHDIEAMRRLEKHVHAEIQRRCEMTRQTANGFKQASPKQVLRTLIDALRGGDWV
jgi:hypothetical protein